MEADNDDEYSSRGSNSEQHSLDLIQKGESLGVRNGIVGIVHRNFEGHESPKLNNHWFGVGRSLSDFLHSLLQVALFVKERIHYLTTQHECPQRAD